MPRYGMRSGYGNFDKIKPTDSGVERYESGGSVTVNFKYQFRNKPLVFVSWGDTSGNDFYPYVDESALDNKSAVILCRKASNRAAAATDKNDVYWVAFERTYST